METIAALMRASDTEMPVGNGCTALTVSRQAQAEMHADGLDHALADSLGRYVVVVDGDGGIVTVAKLFRGRRGRQYRRGRR
jgi:hypothetical protein